MNPRPIAATIAAFMVSLALSPALAADFTLTSTDIGPDKPLAQDFVFSGFGCTGGNQSPALSRCTGGHPELRAGAVRS